MNNGLKALAEAVKALVESVKDMQTVKTIDDGFAHLFGLIFTDPILAKRYDAFNRRNLGDVVGNVAKYFRIAGAPQAAPAQLTEGTRRALTSAMAEEDDPELQDMWARVLYNVASGMPLDKFMVERIRQLDHWTARLVGLMHDYTYLMVIVLADQKLQRSTLPTEFPDIECEDFLVATARAHSLGLLFVNHGSRPLHPHAAAWTVMIHHTDLTLPAASLLRKPAELIRVANSEEAPP